MLDSSVPVRRLPRQSRASRSIAICGDAQRPEAVRRGSRSAAGRPAGAATVGSVGSEAGPAVTAQRVLPPCWLAWAVACQRPAGRVDQTRRGSSCCTCIRPLTKLAAVPPSAPLAVSLAESLAVLLAEARAKRPSACSRPAPSWAVSCRSSSPCGPIRRSACSRSSGRPCSFHGRGNWLRSSPLMCQMPSVSGSGPACQAPSSWVIGPDGQNCATLRWRSVALACATGMASQGRRRA